MPRSALNSLSLPAEWSCVKSETLTGFVPDETTPAVLLQCGHEVAATVATEVVRHKLTHVGCGPGFLEVVLG